MWCDLFNGQRLLLPVGRSGLEQRRERSPPAVLVAWNPTSRTRSQPGESPAMKKVIRSEDKTTNFRYQTRWGQNTRTRISTRWKNYQALHRSVSKFILCDTTQNWKVVFGLFGTKLDSSSKKSNFYISFMVRTDIFLSFRPYKGANFAQPRILQCCRSGSGIWCLFDLRIRDPGWVFSGSRISNPYFWELSDNFLGKKFNNSLKIGPNLVSSTFQK